MTETTLETRIGALASTVPLFVEGTILTSAEIQSARFRDRTLRGIMSYTANFSLYTVEDGKVVLYFGGRENNPILRNLQEACRQLIQTGNYVPSPEEIARAKSTALRVELADLKLTFSGEWGEYRIDTQYYFKSYDLNPTQRALAEAVHGIGDQFHDTMRMLRGNRIQNTTITVLSPDYVKGAPYTLCRASWIMPSTIGNSDFNAATRNVDKLISIYGGVRVST